MLYPCKHIEDILRSGFTEDFSTICNNECILVNMTEFSQDLATALAGDKVGQLNINNPLYNMQQLPLCERYDLYNKFLIAISLSIIVSRRKHNLEGSPLVCLHHVDPTELIASTPRDYRHTIVFSSIVSEMEEIDRVSTDCRRSSCANEILYNVVADYCVNVKCTMEEVELRYNKIVRKPPENLTSGMSPKEELIDKLFEILGDNEYSDIASILSHKATSYIENGEAYYILKSIGSINTIFPSINIQELRKLIKEFDRTNFCNSE